MALGDFWKENGLIIIIVSVILFSLAMWGIIRSRKPLQVPRIANHKLLPIFAKKTDVPRESAGEIECKKTVENFFDKKFEKVRPDFLNNNVTGCKLELDCYNPELKLAIEYNGRQHYEYVPFFHKNKEAMLNQKYRDEMKKTKCIQNGITLIEVPYTIPVPKIKDYILGMLKAMDKIQK